VRFEPDFPDFEVVLLNVFDAMIKAVGIVPRVETKLYSEWVRPHRILLSLFFVCTVETTGPQLETYHDGEKLFFLGGGRGNVLFFGQKHCKYNKINNNSENFRRQD